MLGRSCLSCLRMGTALPRTLRLRGRGPRSPSESAGRVAGVRETMTSDPTVEVLDVQFVQLLHQFRVHLILPLLTALS